MGKARKTHWLNSGEGYGRCGWMERLNVVQEESMGGHRFKAF